MDICKALLVLVVVGVVEAHHKVHMEFVEEEPSVQMVEVHLVEIQLVEERWEVVLLVVVL